MGAIDDVRSHLDLVIWTIFQSLYHLYGHNLKIVILRWCVWVIARPLSVSHCINSKLKMCYSFLNRHREEGRFKFRAHLIPPLPAADAEGKESKRLELLLDDRVHECQKLTEVLPQLGAVVLALVTGSPVTLMESLLLCHLINFEKL